MTCARKYKRTIPNASHLNFFNPIRLGLKPLPVTTENRALSRNTLRYIYIKNAAATIEISPNVAAIP